MSALDGQIPSKIRSPIMAVNQAAMRRRARIMRAVNVPMRAASACRFATPLSANPDADLLHRPQEREGRPGSRSATVRDGDVLRPPAAPLDEWRTGWPPAHPVARPRRLAELVTHPPSLSDSPSGAAARLERVRQA